MPLGDSITAGPFYRAPLQELLATAGCHVDFVGGETDEQPNQPGLTDPDHEGHPGWRADQIANLARQWTAAARPDLVLLHVGTNDFYQDQDVDSTAADIARIVAEVEAAAPSAIILVAQTIPGGGIEKQVAELDRRIATLVSGKVVIVDQASGVDANRDTLDGAHPNPALSRQMAQRWMTALRPLLSRNCTS